MTDTSNYQASTATLTPTRLLLGSNDTMNTGWTYQPSINQYSYINEINLFDNHQNLLEQKSTVQPNTILTPSPPQACSTAKLIQSRLGAIPLPPSPTNQPKNQRMKLLEKNREAAYRCRQKRKKWVHSLEVKSESAEKRNKELQDQVSHLREESIYLRNLLLTHGNCDCDVVQAYLRRTSEQLSNSLSSGHIPGLIGSTSSVSGSESSASSSSKHLYEVSGPVRGVAMFD